MPVAPLPRALREGDVVRIVAPASAFDRAEFDAGLEVLRGFGLRPRWEPGIFERTGWFAGSARRRADELHAAYLDREARAILAVRGGYGVTSVLPLLDGSILAADPKPLIGCSDITALLNVLAGLELPAIHGPMLGALGRGDEAGRERLRTLLMVASKPPPIRTALADGETFCLSPGIARGRLLGGSLTLLASLCGTPFQPNTDGAILCLEDVGEKPYRVDRMLVQLDQAGLLAPLRGVVLGDFIGCDEAAPRTSVRDVAIRLFRSRPLPVLMGLPFGHGTPNLAWPLGAEAEIDAGKGELRFPKAVFAAGG
jgi:muramoyltetrapeptide carboxypeptidase